MFVCVVSVSHDKYIVAKLNNVYRYEWIFFSSYIRGIGTFKVTEIRKGPLYINMEFHNKYR